MQLKKTISTVSQSSDYPGILKAKLDHKIESSTGNVEYLGPPIDPEQWFQVLTFFRWVNSSMHSEAQVRFYVNPTERKTLFWAFPQKARTGMSAQEIDCKDHDTKLGEIQAQGFVAFGTNHSHCSAGAFQSGTDEHDEKNQHGLHITMGHVDQDKFDMHARFYLNGYCFDPDLSAFWDIGQNLRDLLPSSLWDAVARHQMCKFQERPFPDEWKSNIIEVKTTSVSGGYTGPSVGSWKGYNDSNKSTFRTLVERGEDMVDELLTDAALLTETEEQLLDCLDELENEPFATILKLLHKHHLTDELSVVLREVEYRRGRIANGMSAIAVKGKEQDSKDTLAQSPGQDLTDLDERAWGVLD